MFKKMQVFMLMATVKQFEDLISWQEARKLYQSIYKAILDKDSIKDYALIEQIKGSKFRAGGAPYGNSELRT